MWEAPHEKKERNLTPAEKKRKAEFDNFCKEMEQNGYKKKDLTIGVLAANIIAVILMLPFVIGALIMFLIVAPDGTVRESPTTMESLMFLLFLLVFIILHELVHGLTWGFYAKKHLKAINFGFIWKMLTPYCTCTEPLTRWQYIVGAVMPTLLLGFIPAIIASVQGSFWLLGLSAVMLFGGGGDFLIILRILLYRPFTKTIKYYDHPYELGVVAFVK